MMARLGVEVGPRALRGVRLDGWYRPRARVGEVECDLEHPAEAVEALRQHLGPAHRIAVALDLPLLFIKQVKLPPLNERSEEHTSELQSQSNLVCRLLLEKKKNNPHQTSACDLSTR